MADEIKERIASLEAKIKKIELRNVHSRKYHTAETAAIYLGVSKSFVTKKFPKEIESLKIGTRTVYRKEDIDEWLENRQ